MTVFVIITKVVVYITCMFEFITICHANKSVVVLSKRPSKKSLVSLFHATVEVKEWHSDGAEDIAGTVRKFIVSETHGESFREDYEGHDQSSVGW